MSYKVRRIIIDICEDCLKGVGEMCHNPQCALCRHSVDLPFAFGDLDEPQVYETIGILEFDDSGKLVGEESFGKKNRGPCQFCKSLDNKSLGGDYCWNCGRNLRIE